MLSRFDVQVDGSPAVYVERLRSVLQVALELAGTAEFDDSDLPEENLPAWFRAIGSGGSEEAPEFSLTGMRCYLELKGAAEWDVQEWLYRFDPEEDSRGWAWWDATCEGPSQVRIWVDAWGESFFGCDELRWLAFTAGATSVKGPELSRTEVWAASSGGGIPGKT
ncbi:hypothetical protein [Streptomyces endophyticus]|uniref:Uncharacterized protein n=1 Tax=Streptomyces endophyticus TaxID=714166 RepID=A0ABU6F0A7_9ACTN|nr:hypothetical protein [Streptomyces endophyticus]MEB8337409.1 hypothetical protein [Streptomyces endophyticus]